MCLASANGDQMRLFLFCLIFIVSAGFAVAADQSIERPPDPPLNAVKYFQASPPLVRQYSARHSAGIRGVLNLKDGCLRIGKSIPTLDYELIFSEDVHGLYLKHIYDSKKYRIGDYVSGGGGAYTAYPGQSREGCAPEPVNGYAYFISFHMEFPPLFGLRTDCPYGRYDGGDGMCLPYPGTVNDCPKGTVQVEDGTCEVTQSSISLTKPE